MIRCVDATLAHLDATRRETGDAVCHGARLRGERPHGLGREG